METLPSTESSPAPTTGRMANLRPPWPPGVSGNPAGTKPGFKRLWRGLRTILDNDEASRELARAWHGIASGRIRGTRLQLDAILSIYDRFGLEPPSRLRELASGASAEAKVVVVQSGPDLGMGPGG